MIKKRHSITRNTIINLDRYSGKWVAFMDNQPVLWANDFKRLMEKLEKASFPKKPSVMLVPRKDEGPYI